MGCEVRRLVERLHQPVRRQPSLDLHVEHRRQVIPSVPWEPGARRPLPGRAGRGAADVAGPGPAPGCPPIARRPGGSTPGRLRAAAVFHDDLGSARGVAERRRAVPSGPSWTLEARRLDHLVEPFGYRLVEPDGRWMLPDELARAGVAGPDVGRL